MLTTIRFHWSSFGYFSWITKALVCLLATFQHVSPKETDAAKLTNNYTPLLKQYWPYNSVALTVPPSSSTTSQVPCVHCWKTNDHNRHQTVNSACNKNTTSHLTNLPTLSLIISRVLFVVFSLSTFVCCLHSAHFCLLSSICTPLLSSFCTPLLS